ncbi:MAG: bifunctional metallophosphatase/5'-nucleotidase [Solobacterium sp.]|nr:bifunctional metallophosphatase/5'-nucleotidase [Solobacterium sp.]
MDKSLLKLMFRTVIAICASVLLLFGVSKCQGPLSEAPAEDSAYTDVVILSTTDMHGKCWETNLLTDLPEPHNMLRVSTAVNTMRDEYGKENVIVLDNGDLFEGEAISELHLDQYEAGTSDLPPVMAVCLTEIGYDAFVVGNHEFDFNWDTMKRIYNYFEENGVTVLSANTLYDGSDGVHEEGENVFTPYITRTVTVNGNAHTIGILGLENVDISRWETEDKFPGMRFTHPGNEEWSVAEEARRYVAEMKEAGCEFVVVCYHGGLGNDEGQLSFGNNTNHQGLRLIQETSGIDLLIIGHDHNSQYSNTYYRNAEDEDVLLVNGGGQDLTQSIVRFREGEDGSLKWEIVSSENRKLDYFAADEELQEIIRPYAEDAGVMVNEPIGTLLGSWDGNQNFYTEQTDTMDIVLKSMIETGTKAMAQQTAGKEAAFFEKTKTDHTDIDLSVSTVTVRDSYTAVPGEISRKDAYKIFRYTNELYVLPVKGSVIRAMLEENASQRLKARVLNGKPYIYQFDDIYTDLIFGGLSFTYDLSKPAGTRVTITGFSNAREFNDDAVYLAAVSDYLIGNEQCGLRDFTEEDSVLDKEIRIVDGLIAYIRDTSDQEGGVSTDSFDWHWEADYSLTPENTKPYEGPIYAQLAQKPEDGKTYVLYHEASGRIVVEDSGKLSTVPQNAAQNYLVADPLPDNVMLFTVNVVSEDCITLRNAEGKYLTNDKLAWADTMEEGITTWRLNARNGAWQLLTTGDDRPKALEIYKANLSTYTAEPRDNFCFNFYEPLSRD